VAEIMAQKTVFDTIQKVSEKVYFTLSG